MPTAIAYDKSTDSLIRVELEQFDVHNAAQAIDKQPKLVLFVPIEDLDGPHTHLRYFIKRGRVRHRLCHLTDVPAKVRAAFLLAN